MGKDNALKIFPTAKSTEVFMLNRTDWDTFAAATGADIGKLSTIEGVTATAKAYYEWTDSLTPEVKDDGKAFFGRDAVANYFINWLPPAGGGNLPGQGRRGHLPTGGEHAAQVMG